MSLFQKLLGSLALSLVVGAATAGGILPNAGAVLAMGCVEGGTGVGPSSDGLGCDGPDGVEYAYWQPIGSATGTAVLNGDTLAISGQVCGIECVLIDDQLLIAGNDGDTAEAVRLHDGKLMEIALRWKASGEVQIGGEQTGWIIHVTDLD